MATELFKIEKGKVVSEWVETQRVQLLIDAGKYFASAEDAMPQNGGDDESKPARRRGRPAKGNE